MSFAEKFKEMDSQDIKASILFIALVIAIICGLFWFYGGEEDIEINEVEIVMPEDRKQVKDYDSKIEAYSNERKLTSNELSFTVGSFTTQDNTTFSTIDSQQVTEQDLHKLENDQRNLALEERIQELEAENSALKRQILGDVHTTQNLSSADEIREDRNTSWGNDTFGKNSNDLFRNDGFSVSNNMLTQSRIKVTNTDEMIYAASSREQVLQQGSRAEIRLTKGARIQGVYYPENTFLYATTSFKNQRAFLNITKINHTPVDLTVVDPVDGMLGLYMKPETIIEELRKEGGADVIDEVNVRGIPVGTTVKNIFKRRQEVQTFVLINNAKVILKVNI